MRGSISQIETLGLLDGPGVRTVVFLNSCKLRCKYCHNPEMWAFRKPNYTAKSLVAKILKNKPYFIKSNGGVTFSGGEPLLQSKFLIEVAKLLKKENIHIALDTSGVGNNYEELLPYLDLVILDIKHVKEKEYHNLTGLDISHITKFIEVLNKSNLKVWLRQVIIPQLTDNFEYLKDLKKYIKKIENVEKIEFLPFHKMGDDKYKRLGLSNPYQDLKAMDIKKTEELYNYFLSL